MTAGRGKLLKRGGSPPRPSRGDVNLTPRTQEQRMRADAERRSKKREDTRQLKGKAIALDDSPPRKMRKLGQVEPQYSSEGMQGPGRSRYVEEEYDDDR